MAAALVTLDRHISQQESLVVIFGRTNVSPGIKYDLWAVDSDTYAHNIIIMKYIQISTSVVSSFSGICLQLEADVWVAS